MSKHVAVAKKDDSTHKQKVSLRRRVLRAIPNPVIMETHGGEGLLFRDCYLSVGTGVVFEIKKDRCQALARQRPTWAVYRADVNRALERGTGAHLAVNLLDIDPHGQCWPTVDAFFSSERPRAEQLRLVVNCSLRKKLAIGGAYSVKSLKAVVLEFGNDLFPIYLEVCKLLVREHALKAGYTLDHFEGYYCGNQNSQTHFHALLSSLSNVK